MITKKELTGNILKKNLDAKRVMYRWHNKNKSGGNFGINIYYAEEFNRETDKELTGYYSTDGNVYRLRFGSLYSCGINIPIYALQSLNTLFKYIKDHTGWENGLNESPKIQESELLTREEQFKLIGWKSMEVTQ